MKSYLFDLCSLYGVSGDEKAVSSYICSNLSGRCDCRTDALGNVIVFKKGAKTAKNRVMLSAHMDEVGFIITSIDENGYLKFSCVGGIDTKVLLGRRLMVNGNIPGVVGVKPIHLLKPDEEEKLPEIKDLYIDIGASGKEEAEKLVSPGDRAGFFSRYTEYGDGFLMARALDDRAGCALMLKLLEEDLEYDCYFAFTVQEETGLTGGKTAAFSIEPDISVVLETTTAADVAGVKPAEQVCRLRSGPVISYMDRRTIYDRELYRLFFDTARKYSIPCQTKEGVFGGNEAGTIQTTGRGARMAAVSLPARYLHSQCCSVHLDDVENTLDLLKKALPLLCCL